MLWPIWRSSFPPQTFRQARPKKDFDALFIEENMEQAPQGRDSIREMLELGKPVIRVENEELHEKYGAGVRVADGLSGAGISLFAVSFVIPQPQVQSVLVLAAGGLNLASIINHLRLMTKTSPQRSAVIAEGIIRRMKRNKGKTAGVIAGFCHKNIMKYISDRRLRDKVRRGVEPTQRELYRG